MPSLEPCPRRPSWATILIALTLLLLTVGAAGAAGQETREDAAPAPEESEPPPPDPTDADPSPDADFDGEASGTRQRRSNPVELRVERSSPRKVYYAGRRNARFDYRIGGRRARDLRIQVVRRDGFEVMRAWTRNGVRPGRVHTVRWGGRDSRGRFAGKGRFLFRVKEKGGGFAERREAKGERGFRLYANKFPVRARHTYGDGYGAGRGHRGVDVFSRCGAPLQAARGGRVTVKANQPSGAGHYIVISGRDSRLDYVYMHLRGPASVRRGERVKTGQRIGRVGTSGNSSGCHLHFELWDGAWYAGGSPVSAVKRVVRRWDGWS